MRSGAPWSGGEWDTDACQLSEVQASVARLARVALPEGAPPPVLSDGLVRGRHFLSVGVHGETCHGLRYDGDLGLGFDRGPVTLGGSTSVGIFFR